MMRPLTPATKTRAKYFVATFLPLVLVIGAVLAVLYVQERSNREEVIAQREIANVEAVSNVIAAEFDAIRTDLLVLSDHHGLRSYLEGEDEHFSDVYEDFLAFSTRKAVYDQVRYLDETGMEVVRVNYNAGSPSVVPDDRLQNKGNRYYFTDVIGIGQDKVFASPLDLNIENGEIEQPLKPMLRFGTPVYDGEGQVRGIVLLNYFGQVILDRINEASRSAGNVMVLNPDGFFLRGENSENEWGFMYEDQPDITFATQYPDAWDALAASTDEAMTDNGMFIQTTVFPLASADGTSGGAATATGDSGGVLDSADYYWTIVARVPPEALAAASASARTSSLQLFLLLAAIAAAGSYGAASLLTKQRMSRQELEKFAAELERSNKELDDFARIASHDLQEPLRKITAFGDRLNTKYSDELGEKGADYINRMQGAAQRMSTLINDLLKYSRVTTKAQPFEPIVLNEIIDGVMSDLEVRLGEVDGRVDVGDMPTIDADSLQMRQLFQNLVGNALKFHRPDDPPIVTINAELGANGHPADVCQIVVADNGVGFDQEHAERIFGTFERLWGRNEFEGTGVGLSICRKIVQRHGGSIVATGVPGEGATFTISLPVHHKAA